MRSTPYTVPAVPPWALGLVLVAGGPSAQGVEAAETPYFAEVADDAGLDFVHFNGMRGKFYFPEVMGAAAALLDYDSDGDLDLFLPQGRPLVPGERPEASLRPPKAPLGDRLYRNDSPPPPADGGPRRLVFTDVSEAAGVRDTGPGATYGMGVAAGDYDGDGRTDLYVTGYRGSRLLRNAGDGRFEDATARAGAADDRWAVSASFTDYDGDGRLDLYVTRYVDFDVAKNPACFAASSRRDWCGPADFPPQPDRLLRNRGPGPDGRVTFEDVSAASGIAGAPRPGLGVAAGDFDGDGRTDFYVANDGAPNQLWLGRPDGTFEDGALLAGVAVNREGRAEAGMGIAVGDHDNDGDDDLLVTHLNGETNTLYSALGGGLFEDVTDHAGLAADGLPWTSFGTAWIDVDNDGWLDLFVASGDVRTLETQAAAGSDFPLAQPNRLYRNLGPDARGRVRFAPVEEWAGAGSEAEEVGRAVAIGDVDDDGDADLVVANDAGPVRLYRNLVGQDRPWIGFRLLEPSGRRLEPGGREVLGARVEVVRAGGPALVRRAARDGSYAAASDPRALVGLGDAPRIEAVRVHWPGGTVETWGPLEPGRYHTLVRGTAPPPAGAGEDGGGGDGEGDAEGDGEGGASR